MVLMAEPFVKGCMLLTLHCPTLYHVKGPGRSSGSSSLILQRRTERPEKTAFPSRFSLDCPRAVHRECTPLGSGGCRGQVAQDAPVLVWPPSWVHLDSHHQLLDTGSDLVEKKPRLPQKLQEKKPMVTIGNSRCHCSFLGYI